jgi:hypothetical protein
LSKAGALALFNFLLLQVRMYHAKNTRVLFVLSCSSGVFALIMQTLCFSCAALQSAFSSVTIAQKVNGRPTSERIAQGLQAARLLQCREIALSAQRACLCIYKHIAFILRQGKAKRVTPSGLCIAKGRLKCGSADVGAAMRTNPTRSH